MTKLFTALVLALAACAGTAASVPPAAPTKKFSMRAYTFVLLRRGPAWTAEQNDATKRIFEGHMANIRAMHAAGKLVLAGPLEAAGNPDDAYAGLFVMNVASDDEARARLAKDPAIAGGRFVAELRSWYGPVGITYDGAASVTP
jgi:uncharacterized protein YciI